MHIDETTLNTCVCLPVCLDMSLANRCTKAYSWANTRQKEPNARTHTTTKPLSEDGEIRRPKNSCFICTHTQPKHTHIGRGSQMYGYEKLHNSQSESRIILFFFHFYSNFVCNDCSTRTVKKINGMFHPSGRRHALSAISSLFSTLWL